MILFKRATDLSQYILQEKQTGRMIGFVPTMGALHQGHISLIDASKKTDDITVCSIFVNPTQFNNADDFHLYPVTIEKDIEKLVSSGCDVLFLPSKEEMYPETGTLKTYELGNLEHILEGHFRPRHFQGVCQVVDRLLEIIQPDNLYLGAKDYQQCKVISTLVQLIGKQDQIAISIEPTLREEDGLAMSSRNLRLTPMQRKLAPSIFEALTRIKKNQTHDSQAQLEKDAISFLTEKGFKVDYLKIVNTDTLQPASEVRNHTIVVVAAYLENIRLIDNLVLN